jgi:hypothetical protein
MIAATPLTIKIVQSQKLMNRFAAERLVRLRRRREQRIVKRLIATELGGVCIIEPDPHKDDWICSHGHSARGNFARMV